MNKFIKELILKGIKVIVYWHPEYGVSYDLQTNTKANVSLHEIEGKTVLIDSYGNNKNVINVEDIELYIYQTLMANRSFTIDQWAYVVDIYS